LEHFWL